MVPALQRRGPYGDRDCGRIRAAGGLPVRAAPAMRGAIGLSYGQDGQARSIADRSRACWPKPPGDAPDGLTAARVDPRVLATVCGTGRVSEIEGRQGEKLDAEREARRSVALMQIRQYPMILRLATREVDAFDERSALVERMGRLMQEARGE